jgi:uncharacterized protein YycO
MIALKNWFISVRTAIIILIGKIHWAPKNLLTLAEQKAIYAMLEKDYYVIVSRRNNHLSTYATYITSFFYTGKFSYWSHAMMNLEDTVNNLNDFRIVEAIGDGVQLTPFEKAFDVNCVALIKPKNMSIDRWTAVLDKAKSEVGKPYDNLFDLANDKALSCVELVRTALEAEPDYDRNFANFEAMIKRAGNQLTPQMYYDCEDFEVVYEIRR